MKTPELKPSPLATNTSRALSDLSEKGVKEISASLQELLADVFALYVRSSNPRVAEDPKRSTDLRPVPGGCAQGIGQSARVSSHQAAL
jgi:hypothetical protein